MAKHLNNFLNEKIESWLVVILTGSFLFYVLYVFQGYSVYDGQSTSGHSLLFRSICFGLITSFTFILFEFLFPRLFRSNPLSPFWQRFIAVVISLHAVYLLFNYFWAWEDLNLRTYSEFLIEFPLILIVPLGLVWLISKAQKSRISDTPLNNIILFKAENGKDQVCVPLSDLLFLKSDGNYTEIYVSNEGDLKQHLIRRRLGSIETEFIDQGLLKRCHRSYLANVSREFASVKKGGKLELDFGLISIPVSKSFQLDFVPD